MKRMCITLLLLGSAVVPATFAQNVTSEIIIRETNQRRDPIPYSHLREADVTWMKRVWRKLDLREKINHKFYYPIESIRNRRSLVQVLIAAVDEGTLTAYDPLDDEFGRILTGIEVDQKLRSVDSLYMPAADPPYEPELVVVQNEFDPANVKEVRIVEQWFIDKQRSALDVRILGIQLVTDNVDPTTGEVRGKEPMFWVYFPEARNIFANVDVFNSHNDAERKTLDDIFWKRMFGSYIYKVENVYDRQVADYTSGIDQLLEAESLKEEIFAMESSLWEY